MSAKLFFSAVGAVVVLALGVAWNQRQAVGEFESSLGVATQQRIDAEAEIRRQHARLSVVEKARADFQRDLADLQRSKVIATAGPTPQKNPPGAPPPSPQELLQNEPKVQVLWLASQRAMTAANFGPLFKALGLSPEQIGRFQDIAIKREEQAMDLSAITRSQGLSSKDPVVTQLQQQAQIEQETAQKELLGAEGYQQLQEYLRVLPARDVASGFAGAAAVAGMPFTAQQADRLTQAIANGSSRYQVGGAADLENLDWGAIDREVRTILTEAQFAFYQSIEPEGRGARFTSQVGNVMNQARKIDAAGAASTNHGG